VRDLIGRRQWLLSVLRLSAAAGSGIGVWTLATRKDIGRKSPCVADFACSRCRSLSHCGLDRAQAYRASLRKDREKHG